MWIPHKKSKSLRPITPRIRPHVRRANSHHHEKWNVRFPRFGLRIHTQHGFQRQYLDAQPYSRSKLCPAFPLQPVRVQHRRAPLHPWQVSTPEKTEFSGIGARVGQIPFTDSNTTITVPSLKMRTGDFSELLDPSNFFFKKVVVINDPKTGQPFPGNIIPQCPQPVGSCATPNGLGILMRIRLRT